MNLTDLTPSCSGEMLLAALDALEAAGYSFWEIDVDGADDEIVVDQPDWNVCEMALAFHRFLDSPPPSTAEIELVAEALDEILLLAAEYSEATEPFPAQDPVDSQGATLSADYGLARPKS